MINQKNQKNTVKKLFTHATVNHSSGIMLPICPTHTGQHGKRRKT